MKKEIKYVEYLIEVITVMTILSTKYQSTVFLTLGTSLLNRKIAYKLGYNHLLHFIYS